MLEKPSLIESIIIDCLQKSYRLPILKISFLPLGADQNTSVYKVLSKDGKAYFVKVRSDIFNPVSVSLPKYLKDQKIRGIIAPLETRSGQLWERINQYIVIVYPFIEGQNGYETTLNDNHWIEFGKTIRALHDISIPDKISVKIPIETFSPDGRKNVRAWLAYIEGDMGKDPYVQTLTKFLKSKRTKILDLVDRAEKLAVILTQVKQNYVVCHSDLHAGNIFMDSANTLIIVDWDEPIRAPKERDLMYAGGSQFGSTRSPKEEEKLFYLGYGETTIYRETLAYYRYERIVQDLSVYCDQLFLNMNGEKDREQSLKYLRANFLPGNTIEVAYSSDATRT